MGSLSELSLSNLDGMYDITYQTIPPIPGWFESGMGQCQIVNGSLSGKDGHGITWKANLSLLPSKDAVSYEAILDPSTAEPNSGLLAENGQITRERQNYKGILKISKVGDKFSLHGEVTRASIYTINVTLAKQ